MTSNDITKFMDDDEDPDFILKKKKKTVAPTPLQFGDCKCILHNFGGLQAPKTYNRPDGEYALPIIELNEKRINKVKLMILKWLELDGDLLYSPFLDRYHSAKELRENQTFWNLSEFDNLGYHPDCYRVVCQSVTLDAILARQAKLRAKGITKLPPQKPVTTPLFTRKPPPVRKAILKERKIHPFSLHVKSERYRTSFTPKELMDIINQRNKDHHTSPVDILLQTLPPDLQEEYESTVAFDYNECVLCRTHRKRGDEHLGKSVLKFGGRLLLAAVLKNDIVIKTRIQRGIRCDHSIMRHRKCFRFYTRDLMYPTVESVEQIKDMMSLMFTDNERPKLLPKYQSSTRRHTYPGRPIQTGLYSQFEQPIDNVNYDHVTQDRIYDHSRGHWTFPKDRKNLDYDHDMNDDQSDDDVGDISFDSDVTPYNGSQFTQLNGNQISSNNPSEIIPSNSSQRLPHNDISVKATSSDAVSNSTVSRNMDDAISECASNEADNKLSDLVNERIFQKGYVMKLSTLLQMYKDFVDKNDASSNSIDSSCNEQTLKEKLVTLFPQLEFHELPHLNTELVFNSESSM